jgi:phosphate:Na+ symporter
VTAFIGHATIAERLTALDLFKRETNYFIHNSMLFNLDFNSNTRYISENSDYKSINVKKKFFIKQKRRKVFLKQLQGELQVFYLELRPKLQSEQYSNLNQLISAVRSSMHSVKV